MVARIGHPLATLIRRAVHPFKAQSRVSRLLFHHQFSRILPSHLMGLCWDTTASFTGLGPGSIERLWHHRLHGSESLLRSDHTVLSDSL